MTNPDNVRNDAVPGRHSIPTNATLRQALVAINDVSGGAMTLFAIGADRRPQGTVTDGDIRRAIIAGKNLDDPVADAMNRHFLSLRHGDDPQHTVERARTLGITLLPKLDAEGFITEILDLRLIRTILPIDAVLMAGGRGERLRPLTLDCPKPLLKVGGKAIIDYNVEELAACGVTNIFATVNYLHRQIEQHFEKPVGGVRVKCVTEPCRLGTLGSLALVDGLENDNVLVMNSDLLTTLDFAAMLTHHRQTEADLTMAAVPYNVTVPFAILQTEGDYVKGMAEKPTYNHMANAGVYIIRREAIGKIEKGVYLDAPDFILSLISEGRKVSYFPVDGTWIDIGSPADYRYADSLMSRPRR